MNGELRAARKANDAATQKPGFSEETGSTFVKVTRYPVDGSGTFS
jgi:hypothetical protein